MGAAHELTVNTCDEIGGRSNSVRCTLRHRRASMAAGLLDSWQRATNFRQMPPELRRFSTDALPVSGRETGQLAAFLLRRRHRLSAKVLKSLRNSVLLPLVSSIFGQRGRQKVAERGSGQTSLFPGLSGRAARPTDRRTDGSHFHGACVAILATKPSKSGVMHGPVARMARSNLHVMTWIALP
jgi:hypothetical protein